jgi:hypothetical protein
VPRGQRDDPYGRIRDFLDRDVEYAGVNYPGVEASFYTSFVMDKVILAQISEYFGFLCQFSFHRLLHTRRSRGRSA